MDAASGGTSHSHGRVEALPTSSSGRSRQRRRCQSLPVVCRGRQHSRDQPASSPPYRANGVRRRRGGSWGSPRADGIESKWEAFARLVGQDGARAPDPDFHGRNATDLGYLLHKHPARVQQFDVSVGTAHVFYPEATDERCTVALLLEVDPIGLVRGRKGPASEGFALGQYVNDRPYAASSMLAVALARVFKTAMAGRCDARPDLPATALPLQITRAGASLPGWRRLRAGALRTAGMARRGAPVPLDETIPSWGDSRYLRLSLSRHLHRRRRAEPSLRAACRCSTTRSTTGSVLTRSTS